MIRNKYQSYKGSKYGPPPSPQPTNIKNCRLMFNSFIHCKDTYSCRWSEVSNPEKTLMICYVKKMKKGQNSQGKSGNYLGGMPSYLLGFLEQCFLHLGHFFGLVPKAPPPPNFLKIFGYAPANLLSCKSLQAEGEQYRSSVCSTAEGNSLFCILQLVLHTISLYRTYFIQNVVTHSVFSLST